MDAMKLTTSNIAQSLADIRDYFRLAEDIANQWENRGADGDEKIPASFYIESAFVRTLALLDALGLSATYHSVAILQRRARKDYTKTFYVEGLYFYWLEKLRMYVDAIQSTAGEPKTDTVKKDLVEILRATQYAITDTTCFQQLPANEGDVHARIEAVLRCVFPDLLHKPPIAKPIKNFIPDTGLPSVRTLIEYKFISTKEDAKRVADEVLADTRGYICRDWNKFVYVIYETARIEPERHWMQLLDHSDASLNTSVIVIPGERPGGIRIPLRSAEKNL